MNLQNSFLFLAILFIGNLSLSAQHYSAQKGQLEIAVKGERCQFESPNTTVRADLERRTGVLTFTAPVRAFQLNEQSRKKAFTPDCLSMKEFPMISFDGKFENIGSWPSQKSGTVSMKLKGIITMKGKQLPFSENVSFQVEKNVISISFNTSLTLEGMEVDLDCELTFLEQQKEKVKVQ